MVNHMEEVESNTMIMRRNNGGKAMRESLKTEKNGVLELNKVEAISIEVISREEAEQEKEDYKIAKETFLMVNFRKVF